MAITGILWHKTSSETTILQEIDVAKKHYISKIREMPTVALINKNHEIHAENVGDLLILGVSYIGYNHILIGKMEFDQDDFFTSEKEQ